MRAQGFDFSLDRFGTRVADHRPRNRIGKAYDHPFRLPGLDVVRDTILDRGRARDVRDDAIDRCLAVAEIVCGSTNAHCFVDGSKQTQQLIHLARRPDVDLRVIHLVRDGRGVVNSTLGHKQAGGMTPEIAADAWRKYHERFERIRRRHFGAEQAYTLRYEDFCADPVGTLHELHRFLGLTEPPVTGTIDTQSLHVLGNQMRMQPVTEITVDVRWRETLSPEALEAFERRAGAVNRRYGYEA